MLAFIIRISPFHTHTYTHSHTLHFSDPSYNLHVSTINNLDSQSLFKYPTVPLANFYNNSMSHSK